MFMGYSAPLCALAGTLACFPVAMLRASTRQGLSWTLIWDALVDGSRNTLAVALACACAGLVIGSITLTGLGLTFTNEIGRAQCRERVCPYVKNQVVDVHF